MCTHVKISHLVTTCYQAVTRCVRTASAQLLTSQHKLLISTCNKVDGDCRLAKSLFQQVHTTTDLLGQTCSRSAILINPCYKLITTCQQRVATTGTSSANKSCNDLMADLLQLVCRFVTTCAFLRV